MQIQANTVGTQAVAHHSDAATGVGRMGQLEARQVATGQDAILLGSRSEPQKGQGLLSRLGAQLARPFVAIKEWISNLLGTDKRAAAPNAQTAVSPEDLQRLMKQAAFGSSLGGFAKADVLNNITGEQLGKDHASLATGNGPLRSLCTALQAVVIGSQQPQLRELAAGLLARPIAGIPLQQWGTVGGKVTELLTSAPPELLKEAMSQLHTAMGEVADLQRAVKAEVAGEPARSATTAAAVAPLQSGESEVNVEPADKALAEGLQEQFGLEAEQYLGEQPHGTYTDAEVMALGLYTNGEYQHLNRSLRQEKQLDAGQALIDQGMSAAFEKNIHGEQLVKTFRGTHGGDAFSSVAEGLVGHDVAYLSTSSDPKVANNFGGSGSISTIFGRSGIDVSEISIEGDEQEILYNKATDMRVLLSAKDERGVTRRVLEEASLGEQSGHSKGLLDGLDLARGAGGADKPQEQDIRLKMRGLDLA
ncbi:ADP-ribosyltransferase [Aeromonas salmonicida]|uniref:T3SS effector ADP-ribosyltransferase toxin AexT n=1 Tax=Aeromonas salmonicida TaxID=645 RepID=UPI000F7856D1|nr:T3SS effector ADP-ribosyltransferase toxin AexT [Aeromonas salmonicida]RSM22849.1 ADP-ribosyltransferase [Aeromonas salmonicida]